MNPGPGCGAIARDIATARRFFTRLRRYRTARQAHVRIPD